MWINFIYEALEELGYKDFPITNNPASYVLEQEAKTKKGIEYMLPDLIPEIEKAYKDKKTVGFCWELTELGIPLEYRKLIHLAFEEF